MFVGNISHVRENENWQFCFKPSLRVLYCISACYDKMREGYREKEGLKGGGGERDGWAVMVFRFSEIDPHKSDSIRNQGTKFPSQLFTNTTVY
jgi:hypothetical protein